MQTYNALYIAAKLLFFLYIISSVIIHKSNDIYRKTSEKRLFGKSINSTGKSIMSYRHALPRARFASFRLYFIINEIRSTNEATIDAVHLFL